MAGTAKLNLGPRSVFPPATGCPEVHGPDKEDFIDELPYTTKGEIRDGLGPDLQRMGRAEMRWRRDASGMGAAPIQRGYYAEDPKPQGLTPEWSREMAEPSTPKQKGREINRRDFVKTGGAALAAGAALVSSPPPVGATPADPFSLAPLFPTRTGQDVRIQSYRTLGRTGWKASDIGFGTGPLREANLIRYAFDKGINYFDTAESYENGGAERAIGEALQHVDRKKIFIATKAGIRPSDDTEAVIGKVRQSLERLRTDYVDAYSIHYVSTVEGVSHPGYHAAMDLLKAEGRVKFTGASYHGPGEFDQTGTADVLCAAAEDGRFDMLLFVYNFLNHSEGDRILAACEANNVGATAMKTAPGTLRAEPFDPENLTGPQQEYYDNMVGRGRSHEDALAVIRKSVEDRKQVSERAQPFVDRYGIQTDEALRFASIQWVLQNSAMHTACISIDTFDLIDKLVALSGTKLTAPAEDFIQETRLALNSQYCRHGCVECIESCPVHVPVSTIMRYAYYFEGQGRERYAMGRYAELKGLSAGSCSDCVGHCAGACRYGIDIQPNMLQVHDLLTLA